MSKGRILTSGGGGEDRENRAATRERKKDIKNQRKGKDWQRGPSILPTMQKKRIIIKSLKGERKKKRDWESRREEEEEEVDEAKDEDDDDEEEGVKSSPSEGDCWAQQVSDYWLASSVLSGGLSVLGLGKQHKREPAVLWRDLKAW